MDNDHDETQLDDKKPLDDIDGALHLQNDQQPVPDEILQFDNGDGRVWLVKVPKFLMERWETIHQANVHIATMRVYNDENGGTRISLFLPDAPRLGADRVAHVQYDTSNLSKEYFLELVNQEVDNQVLVSEKDIDPPNGRAKSTHLLGNIIHECNIRPIFNDSYRDTVAARHKAANQPKRQIKLLSKDDVKGGTGALNKLSSGTAQPTSFDKFVKTVKKSGKEFERFARIPRDQLLDILFGLFEQRSSWSFKDLRTRTEQPGEYLKEILALIATLHRSGELNGQYTLLDNYKATQNQDAIKREESIQMQTMNDKGVDEEDDDEDEEDDDMEEVQ